jgi:hypothetical protein
MDRKTPSNPGMSSPAIYQITVQGRLDDHWADWFNETEISIEQHPDGKQHTRLTCRVRDQAELFGILNQLNSLNLPLIGVALIDT